MVLTETCPVNINDLLTILPNDPVYESFESVGDLLDFDYDPSLNIWDQNDVGLKQPVTLCVPGKSLGLNLEDNLETFQDLEQRVSPTWSVVTTESDLPNPETSQQFALSNKTSQLSKTKGPQQTQAKYRQLRNKNNEACQRSRLKKKTQFQVMERRIAALEEENRMLRCKLDSVRFDSCHH